MQGAAGHGGPDRLARLQGGQGGGDQDDQRVQERLPAIRLHPRGRRVVTTTDKKECYLVNM